VCKYGSFGIRVGLKNLKCVFQFLSRPVFSSDTTYVCVYVWEGGGGRGWGKRGKVCT